MPDKRFFSTKEPLTISECLDVAGATLVSGNADNTVKSVADYGDDNLESAAIFCADKAHIKDLSGKKAGLCLTTEKLKEQVAAALTEAAVATLSSPRLGFAKLADRLHQPIEDSSSVDLGEREDEDAIHPSAAISDSAKLGSGVKIGAHVFIGPGVEIGAETSIASGVSITHAIIGKNCRILSGARIGQAGFGFVESPEGLFRVPQLGRVIIGDDAEIGANCCIDRGALGDTEIGQGTKIDNLVQIAHNVRIGRHCVLAAQTGISGSCIIGDGVFMGGQVGLADHLTIGDGAQIAAGSGLMRDVPPGERWGGAPARTVREWLRETAALSKLAKKKNG